LWPTARRGVVSGQTSAATSENSPAVVNHAQTALPASETAATSLSRKNGGSFGGNVIRLASGTAIAQVILMAATPILSRLYSPDAFGVAALFLAVTGIISVIGCLRYEYAIVLPEADAEARRLLFASMAIAVIVGAVSAVVVLLLGPLLLRGFNMVDLQPFLWLIPVSIVAQSLIQALSFWNTRKSAFFKVATSKVVQAAVTTILALTLGMAGYGTASSMIGSSVAGFSGAALMLVVVSLVGSNYQSGHGAGTDATPFSVLRRYRKFASHSTGPALLNSISWQLPALLLGVFFSPGVVGLYALTMKVIQTPVGMIHQAVSQVFYREVVTARSDGTLDRLVGSLFASLSKAALLPCLLVVIAGKELFILIFGPAWIQAGLFAQILAPWVFLLLITAPLSVIYLALERQGEEIKVQIVIFTSRCLSLLVGGYIGDPVLTITLFSLSGIFAYIYLFVVICRCAGIHALRHLANIFPTFVIALVCAIPSAFVVYVSMPRIAILMVVSLTAAAHAAFLIRGMRSAPVIVR
jgi:lipopolysaccharide exporter